MGVRKKLVGRAGWSAVVLCVITVAASVAAAQQSPASAPSPDATLQTRLPDSPGATLAALQPPAQQQIPSSSSPITPDSEQPQEKEEPQEKSAQVPLQQSSPSQAQPPQKPVGTAAAESTHAAGIAASQPAGVAIAPAKQRRVRTIVIRTAALIGAGVAVGSVVALTAATSSKPPGAH